MVENRIGIPQVYSRSLPLTVNTAETYIVEWFPS